MIQFLFEQASLPGSLGGKKKKIDKKKNQGKQNFLVISKIVFFFSFLSKCSCTRGVLTAK